MQTKGINGPYVISYHPNWRKQIKDGNVAQTIKDTGIAVIFTYATIPEYIGESKIVVTTGTDIPDGFVENKFD